jgi:hypothetical protein
MRKVTVSIPEVHMSYITLEVDDDTPDYDIKDRANLLLESGGYQDNLEYSHTMNTDMWDITDEDTSSNV